jgi:hypothetical protein
VARGEPRSGGGAALRMKPVLACVDPRDGGSRGESFSPRSEAPQAPDLVMAAEATPRDRCDRVPP